MERQVNQWKSAIEAFWSAASPDYRAMAQLIAEMASSEDDTLRRAATQVLPVLRAAVAPSADRATRETAGRRLSIVHDALHRLAAPRFGKRGFAPRVLTSEDQYRQMLGLPLGRRLEGPEIHQAFKRAAKSVHPDTGGNGKEFLDLVTARDALMKRP
jgi:hypothetical protein